MSELNASESQVYHAKIAANHCIAAGINPYLTGFASDDVLFYEWLAIESENYIYLGGLYGDNESDELHNIAGEFARSLIIYYLTFYYTSQLQSQNGQK